MKVLTKTLIALIGMLIGGVSLAAAQREARIPEIQKVPDVATTSCSDQDRNEVAASSVTSSVLSNYGLDVRDGIWKCSSLRTPWLQSGMVLSLQRISAQVDSGENVTIVSLPHEPHLWIIPVYSGMIGYPNTPDEIHNRAAFNAILSENQVRPRTPEMWLSTAMLYLNMVGVEIHVADWKAHGEMMHGLASSADFFHKKGLLPSVECDEEQCVVTINDTQTTSVTQQLTTWVLTFTTSPKSPVRLEGVEQQSKPLRELP